MLAASFTGEDKSKLRRFLAAVELLRQMHPDAKVRWLSELLNIALDEGEGVREYAKRMNVHNNVMSVDLLTLGPMMRDRSPGLDLIQAQSNRDDLRKHEITLTPSGRSMITKMLRFLKD